MRGSGVRILFGALTMTIFAPAITHLAAQAKTDCSKYSGVDNEACEKMASKRR